MAGKTGGKTDGPKRLNRTVAVGEALGGVLGPALKRRGFASRDLLTHWRAMAPEPYGEVARPERLAWSRGQKGAEGATLYLRCAPGHALALAHEGARVAAAVNRYYGYLLVGTIRLSAEPFTPIDKATHTAPAVAPETAARVAATVGRVSDPGLREALRLLGHGVVRR